MMNIFIIQELSKSWDSSEIRREVLPGAYLQRSSAENVVNDLRNLEDGIAYKYEILEFIVED